MAKEGWVVSGGLEETAKGSSELSESIRVSAIASTRTTYIPYDNRRICRRIPRKKQTIIIQIGGDIVEIQKSQKKLCVIAVVLPRKYRRFRILTKFKSRGRVASLLLEDIYNKEVRAEKGVYRSVEQD